MADPAMTAWNVGFLTVLHEPTGYLGGYLLTNQWGRPLEFRLSTAVQPNRVQQILYGDTLLPYICGDLIGKTLIDKSTIQAAVIVTDREAVLELRQRLDIPVFLLKNKLDAGDTQCQESSGQELTAHPRFPEDVRAIGELMERLGEGFEWTEPFTRIREAIGEARKMGVTIRG
jgi:hypothetical protein